MALEGTSCAVYVFDLSQTEGKELPALTTEEGDVTGYP